MRWGRGATENLHKKVREGEEKREIFFPGGMQRRKKRKKQEKGEERREMFRERV